MIVAFLTDIDGSEYSISAYGVQYGRYGESTARGITYTVYEANLVKSVDTESVVMALPIGGLTAVVTPSREYQAYIGDDFYA